MGRVGAIEQMGNVLCDYGIWGMTEKEKSVADRFLAQ